MLAQPAATAILVVTIAISLLGMYRMPSVIDRSLFRPYWFLRARRFETIFTSGFVHADLGHLLFNMVTFFFFAFPLETAIGTWRFALLYAIGLVLSHSCSYFKHKHDQAYASLGASGAISALFAIGYVGYSWWAAQQARGRINHDAHFCGALSGLAFVAGTDPDAYRALIEMLL